MTDTRLSPPARHAHAEPAGRLPVGAGDACLWLLAAGLIWLVPAWYDRRAIVALVLWDSLVVVAAAIDCLRMPAPHDVRVERRWAGALTLGEPATVTLDVQVRVAPVDLSLTDYPPGLLSADLPTLRLAVRPGVPASGAYVTVPREIVDERGRINEVNGKLLFAVAREAVLQRAQGLRNYISFFEAELVRRVEDGDTAHKSALRLLHTV